MTADIGGSAKALFVPYGDPGRLCLAYDGRLNGQPPLKVSVCKAAAKVFEFSEALKLRLRVISKYLAFGESCVCCQSPLPFGQRDNFGAGSLVRRFRNKFEKYKKYTQIVGWQCLKEALRDRREGPAPAKAKTIRRIHVS